MMREIVDQWVKLTEAVAAGESGKDYSVVEDELTGYETTPLEDSLYKCAEALHERLRQRPGELTPELATEILQAALRCAPGIGGYRARLMMYAGDWGDASSPVAGAVRDAVGGVGDALRALGPSGDAVWAGIPAEVLQAKLTLYVTIAGGEKLELDETIEEHFRSSLI